jgi:hypothetical protein
VVAAGGRLPIRASGGKCGQPSLLNIGMTAVFYEKNNVEYLRLAIFYSRHAEKRLPFEIMECLVLLRQFRFI